MPEPITEITLPLQLFFSIKNYRFEALMSREEWLRYVRLRVYDGETLLTEIRFRIGRGYSYADLLRLIFRGRRVRLRLRDAHAIARLLIDNAYVLRYRTRLRFIRYKVNFANRRVEYRKYIKYDETRGAKRRRHIEAIIRVWTYCIGNPTNALVVNEREVRVILDDWANRMFYALGYWFIDWPTAQIERGYYVPYQHDGYHVITYDYNVGKVYHCRQFDITEPLLDLSDENRARIEEYVSKPQYEERCNIYLDYKPHTVRKMPPKWRE